MDIWLSITSLVFTVVTSILAGIIAFLGLQFTAKPRIAITFKGEEHTQRKAFRTNEVVGLKFLLENRGRLYAKPAATNNTLYINFDPAFEVIGARYGAVLELAQGIVHRGKANSKYLKVDGIHLFHGEPGEEVVVEAKIPNQLASYDVWIAARSDECDHGVHKFKVDVVERGGP